NDLLRFEQLLLRMIVSNALPFIFVENKDTIAVFEFLISGLKLPKYKVISNIVLMKSAQSLQENIIKTAQSDTDRVTATFDGWMNGRQKHIWVSDNGYVEEDKTIRWTNESLEKNKYLENLISEWIEFGEHEHQFKNKDDEILLSNEWNSDFSLEEQEKTSC
ncbi:28522_t:CDS:2, partial [Gigaspora margarita]